MMVCSPTMKHLEFDCFLFGISDRNTRYVTNVDAYASMISDFGFTSFISYNSVPE